MVFMDVGPGAGETGPHLYCEGDGRHSRATFLGLLVESSGRGLEKRNRTWSHLESRKVPELWWRDVMTLFVSPEGGTT